MWREQLQHLSVLCIVEKCKLQAGAMGGLGSEDAPASRFEGCAARSALNHVNVAFAHRIVGLRCPAGF